MAVGGLSLSLTLDPSLLKSAGTARLLPASWDVPCSPVGFSECGSGTRSFWERGSFVLGGCGDGMFCRLQGLRPQ